MKIKRKCLHRMKRRNRQKTNKWNSFAKEALELALTMEALFEPFADGTPEFQKLKDKIAQLKEQIH